ncbi:MAG: hypothetical protein R3F35_00275 [Myxococcota bacterium]
MGRTRLRGLSIADIQIGIELPDRCAWDFPETGIEDFVCLPREPEVHVGLRVGPISQADLGGERYALGPSTFELARRGEDWLIGLSRNGRRRQLAVFASDFRVGEVVQCADWARERRYPLSGGLDEWIVLHRTVARGGLCLGGRAVGVAGGAQVDLGPGHDVRRGWRVAAPALLGRRTLVLREQAGALRVFATPWCDAMAIELGGVARVVELCCSEASVSAYRELLDPGEAAEQLASHAVLPLADERFLDRVLRNAARIAEGSRMLRVGRAELDVERARARTERRLPNLLTPLFGVV